MKKKITAFLLAFNIFAYTTVCCYTQPVFALPVVTAETLFNGLITLLFSLGVTLDLTNVTTETANDIMSNYIEGVVGDNPTLQEQYEQFLSNLQYGYIMLGRDLYLALLNANYQQTVLPDKIAGSFPSSIKPFLGRYTGYYYYLSNFALDSAYSYGDSLYVFEVSQDNNVCLVPPELFEAGNMVNYNRYFVARSSSRYRSHYFGLQNGTYREYSHTDTETIGQIKRNQLNNLTYYVQYINAGFSADTTLDTLVDVSNESDYDLLINGVWTNESGYMTTLDGTYPQVIDGDTIGGLIDDVKDGTKTWDTAVNAMIGAYPENPAVPDIGLDLATLDSLVDSLQLERLESKFPFCIPHDLMLIMNGATSVSSNQAPVIEIPFKLEFNGQVYYENDRAVVIDFNDFSGVVHIFREGFFLLFLIALLWVSIEILQAFFVVTE